MKQKSLFILGIFLGMGKILSAQNIDDLARYSGNLYQGTARATGVGNAMGAVGADFGAIDINPAGLGLYRRGEFDFTMNYNQASSNSSYLGTSTSDNASNFNIGSLGLVFAKPKMRKGQPVESGWVSSGWSIGFSRTNNFWNNTTITGTNMNNSFLNALRDDANNQAIGPHSLSFGSLGYLGWNSYLVDNVSNNDTTHYTDRTRFQKINVYQQDVVQESGATNNIALSFAGNYENKLFLGGSIVIPTVNYTFSRTFTETNLNPVIDSVDVYRKAVFKDYYNTSGIGITAKLGAIYRFNDMFRVGIAVQLPTAYSLTDNFSRTLDGYSKLYHDQALANDNAPYDYNITTPAKITASAAMFFGKNGFVSADYQYTDYAGASASSQADANGYTYDYSDLNQSVRNSLAGVHNLRIGGEYRIEAFSLRAGYNYISSPYKSGLTLSGFSNAYNIFSAGCGFRAGKMGIDLTYQYLADNNTYTPYTLNDGTAASASVQNTRGSVLLTVSSRF